MTTDQHTARAIDAAAALLADRTIAVATGAGISTDSGIPDYRGEGSTATSPMNIQQFTGDPDYYRRYWMGGHLGWERFSTVRPNRGHRMLSRWEVSGRAVGCITQNVDGLHLRAGSARVVELHGAMHRVRCLRCDQIYARESIEEGIRRSLPQPMTGAPGGELRPDGDVAGVDIPGFEPPYCSRCAGLLKPDLVYFGEFIPPRRFALASALVTEADALLVVGSSLVVNSGIRLVALAQRLAKPVVIINRGATRADARAAVKIDADASDTLEALDRIWQS